MRDRYSGKSRGFGFVTFYSADNAQRIATAEHNIDGRRCDAKFALPRGNNVSTTSPPKVPRIFVARVPQTISDVQFKTYWEDFGPVEVGLHAQSPVAACTAACHQLQMLAMSSLLPHRT